MGPGMSDHLSGRPRSAAPGWRSIGSCRVSVDERGGPGALPADRVRPRGARRKLPRRSVRGRGSAGSAFGPRRLVVVVAPSRRALGWLAFPARPPAEGLRDGGGLDRLARLVARAALRRRRPHPPDVVGGRIGRLRAVRGAHARARGRQQPRGEEGREEAPLDPDRVARPADGGLVEQPPQQQQRAPSRRPP